MLSLFSFCLGRNYCALLLHARPRIVANKLSAAQVFHWAELISGGAGTWEEKAVVPAAVLALADGVAGSQVESQTVSTEPKAAPKRNFTYKAPLVEFEEQMTPLIQRRMSTVSSSTSSSATDYVPLTIQVRLVSLALFNIQEPSGARRLAPGSLRTPCQRHE